MQSRGAGWHADLGTGRIAEVTRGRLEAPEGTDTAAGTGPGGWELTQGAGDNQRPSDSVHTQCPNPTLTLLIAGMGRGWGRR